MFFLETLVVLINLVPLCITLEMLKTFQHTLNDIVTFEGVGLHTGKRTKVRVIPAKSDQGIVFKRTDLKEKNKIIANFQNVSSAKLCTTLENEYGFKVSTVEHLLAAFYVSDIDNVVVEIDNEEVPIMDGSAKNFIDLFNSVGIKKLSKRRKYLKILNKIELQDGEKNFNRAYRDIFF